MKIFLSVFVVLVSLTYCTEKYERVSEEVKPVLPSQPYAYDQLALPEGTQPASSIINNFEIINGNPVFSNNQTTDITPWGATLGRVLFYDKKLSLNNTVACGSCHHQDKAFADGKRFSTGFEGRVTPRNSMAIVNPIVQNNLFWDSRSKTIHDLSLQPIQNHVEMGMENLDRLVAKLEDTDYYKPLFKKVYGDEYITAERIAKAISQFVGSITSNRSKFDIGMRNGFSDYTALEKMGRDLFNSQKAKCSSCHGGNNLSALDGPTDAYGGSSIGTQDLRGATNIGLDLVYKDQGLGDGKFKIPGLRNIELTAPYMHDGRFSTLEDVIDHYSEGIKPHKDLDEKFMDKKGNVVQLHLTSLDKKALVAFLKTLTDQEMISDPKWSDPFKI
ncbi:MAG: cytochrome c peroxidase [Saprospiraceae bacterium]